MGTTSSSHGTTGTQECAMSTQECEMSTQELIDELEDESAAMCLNLTAPPEAATWTLERIRGYFESPESSPASESTAAVPGYLVEEMRIAEEAAAAACQIVTNYRSTLEVDTK